MPLVMQQNEYELSEELAVSRSPKKEYQLLEELALKRLPSVNYHFEGSEHVAEHEYKLKYAALCQCILSPLGFDNYKLWRLMPREIVSNRDFFSRLSFCFGQRIWDVASDSFLLGSSDDGDIDYFACWPSVFDVVHCLSTVMPRRNAIALINSCCINSAYKLSDELNEQAHHSRGGAGAGPGGNGPKQDPNSPYNYQPWRFEREYLGTNSDLKINRPKSSSCALLLKIMGGFMAALGAVAVALAFTILFPPITALAIATAASGVAAIIGGIGLFAGADRLAAKPQSKPNPQAPAP